MGRKLRILFSKIKTTVAVATLVGAQVAGALTPFLPSKASAAIVSSSVSSTGFVIKNNSSYSVVAGQPTAGGSFKNGNVGAYPEGACIPADFQVTNTSGTTGELFVTPVIDYLRSGTKDLGFTGLETTTFSGNDATTATNLNQLTFPGTSLSSATSFKTTTGATVTASVSGPYGGNDTSTTAPLTTDTFRHYNITLQNVPNGATVNVLTCGRLGLDASEYNGSSLSIRTVQGGAENVPIPVNQILVLPSITITKAVTQGAALPSDFTFTVSPAVNGLATYSIPVGQTSVTIPNVNPDGTYTITESGPAGYRFTGGTGTSCTVVAGSVGTASGQMSATVAAGKPATDATCNFTNTVNTGSITIVKDAVPNSSTAFPYTATGTGVSNFSLTDNGTASNTKTFSGLLPGSFSFTEGAVTGWDFSGINCSAGSTVQTSGTTVTVTLSAGQNVTCTYTNLQRGHIVVNKVTSPANDTTSFPITATSSTGGNITGGGSASVATNAPVTYDVSQGTYSVAETVPSGWSLASNTCTNLVIDANTPLVNGVPTLSCTITNTKLAKLKIVKSALPFSTQSFGYTTTGTGLSPFSLVDDSASTTTNQQQFSNLAPGAYSVTEQSTPGWALTGLSCDTNNYTTATSTVNVNLAAGQETTCTYTNTKLGSLSGTKYEVNSDSTQVGSTGLSGWTVNLFLNGQFYATTTTDSNGNYSFNGLLPGNYSTFEALVSGWTQIYGTNPVSLTAGQDSTGNNFGNFQNASISGYKFNDLNGNGVADSGEAHLSGWTINLYKGSAVNPTATTATDGSGNYSFTNLAPDTYKLCEVQQTGWVQTYPANNTCNSVTVALSGHNYTDTNFGNQGRGTITVVKNVDDGFGNVTSDVTNWNWNIDGSGNFTTGSANAQAIAAGTYTVSEVQKTNYHVTASSCTNETVPNSPTTSLSATVSAGENVICTFTNTRDTGGLTVIKHVVNDNGGTATASDFTVHVTQSGTDVAGSPAAGSETGTLYTLTTGTYVVSENTPLSGYTQTSIVCNGQNTNQVTVSANSPSTCTITNNDISPQLTVIKHVINDNSGTSVASDFTLNVTGTNVAPNASFPGSEAGTTVTLNAGSYSVSETPDTGYTTTYSAGCSGTLALAGMATCTVTNNDVPHPGIHVVKSGPATAHEGDKVTYTFTITNTGDTTLSGTTVNDDIAGTGVYQSGDTNNNGLLDKTETWVYTAQYTIPTPQVANVDNTVTACATDPAQTQVCDTDMHTLDVLHPGIHVVKSGPQYGYEGMTVGYTFVVTNTGDTTLSNVGIDDNLAIGELCDANTLAPGASTNCTAHYLIPIPTILDVINTVTASGTDSLGRTVTATDQHDLDVIHPSIHVVKSGPATAHEGDTVTYTFTVTNTGDIPLSSVTVTDNVAGNAVYQSGDTNADGMLDLDETWVFTKDYTIPTPQVANVVNTATVCGYDPIQAVANDPTATCDTDMHTLDVLHPGIHVVKTGPANAYQGDHVTYTFTVTNTGDTPLSSLTVSDNVAGDGVYQSGDTNANGLLDVNETWVYTADFIIPTPSGDVTNTVTVCGDDSLDGQACDTDTHTTHIYHPMIVVDKEVVTTQAKDDGLFNLQIDDSTAGTGEDVGDGGTTGAIEVTPGRHSVGEVAGTNTSLSDYDSTYSCDNEQTGTGTSASFSIEGDDVVTCTFTNVRHARLTVVKQAFPVNSSQSFTFSLSLVNPVVEEDNPLSVQTNTLNQLGGSTLSLVKTFQLDDNTDPTLSNNDTSSLSPGTYEVSEASTDGWDLLSMDCGDVTVTKNGSAIRFELAAGQQLTCTFVNQKHIVPQVLGASTVLSDTGVDLLAYTLAALTLLGTAIIVIRYRSKLD